MAGEPDVAGLAGADEAEAGADDADEAEAGADDAEAAVAATVRAVLPAGAAPLHPVPTSMTAPSSVASRRLPFQETGRRVDVTRCLLTWAGVFRPGNLLEPVFIGVSSDCRLPAAPDLTPGRTG